MSNLKNGFSNGNVINEVPVTGDLKFRIENDILIGEEAPIHKKCTNVGALVLEKLKSRPEFIAQVEAVTGAETTFAEMTEKSVKCALWLREQGVQPGDIIGICTHNHLESYVPLLAALYLGAISNPWDNELSPTTARYFLSLTRPKIVFVNGESAECLAQVVKENNMDTRLVTFDDSAGPAVPTLTAVLRSQDTGRIDEFECAKLTDPGHIATIVCSSGTSGFPKGTEISHAAMINYMAHVKIHDLKGHVSMWTPSMRWYCGLFIIIKAILDYSKRIIVPDDDNDEGLCRFIEKCDSCFPIRLVKFGVLSKYRLPTLKILLFGGSHFKGELQQTLVKLLPHTNVILSYGMTDYGGLCARQTKYSKPGSCGFVCETGRLKVVDPNTGKVLGANKTGEIWAKSSYMMNGYYNNPEATKRALDSDGWLHTGDLGYYDNDGEIFLVDRMSEFINYRSIKISPAEIEALIQQHPAVLQVSVVPMPHHVDEEHAMAFVVKVPGKEVTELDITDLVKRNMPWYCRLHAGVKFMERLPRTATGKIAKKELKQIAKSYATNCCRETFRDMAMSNGEKADEYAPSFRIEENVLIGTEETHPVCANVGELVLNRLSSKPDFVGQVDAYTGKECTYAELRERSIKCALWLRKHGIQKGDYIGILTENHLNTCVPIFASLYIGGVICPWDHVVPKLSARYFLSMTSPKVVFVNEESTVNLVEAAKEENLEVKVVVIGSMPGFVSLADILEEQVGRAEIDGFCCTKIDNPHDLAMICSSSGTTGMPKGAELSYASLYNSITPVEEIHLKNEICAWVPTIRWHVGLTQCIEIIMSDAKWVVFSDDNINEISLCEIIQKHEVTWLGSDTSFPIFYIKMNMFQKYPLPSLRKMVVSGAPFTKEFHKVIAKIMPHTQILQCYGLTDAGGLCVSQAKNSKPGSCGFVTKGVRIKIADEKTGIALGPNKKGEICIRSEFIMSGYHKNPEQTEEALDSDGWLHTKDIGYYDEKGEIFFVNRISDFINYKTINLSPAEIEGVLELHPSVLKAVVISVPHETDVELPLAFVQKVGGKEVTEEELHDLVHKNLPWYCKLQAGIKFVDNFPRTSTGKIDKKKLKILELHVEPFANLLRYNRFILDLSLIVTINLFFVTMCYYGSTDMSCICSVSTRFTKLGSVGYVASNVRIKIVGLNTEKALGSKSGELCIKTSTMTQGYHNNPDATKQCFDSDVTEKKLISLVEKNMPNHCRLRSGVKFVDQLPRTTTGKIAKKQLRKIYAK
ncbi:PREDICTED: uncharacterized protein LOC106748773 [Dinoponera quadriceps]|uniref:Uncharacterized protein LOC106748773 n=1 Tax=Dinoponera quadriceps TaxID=609295 RepID=A0A6P3XYG5_DINQU|nr:PREDICTED: uncharacterized protein LOC106748773 [Dinoponera quadriceps]